MKKRFLYAALLCTIVITTYCSLPLFFPAIFTQNQQKEKTARVVYVDMVADLFHYGHVSFLEKAKKFGDKLIVGLISDEGVRSYKRLPYMTLEERCKSVAGCKFVDEVIANTPLRVTAEFIKEHNIDVVVHGDDFSSEQFDYYYGEAIRMEKFQTVSYTKEISTTEIIQRIKSRA